MRDAKLEAMGLRPDDHEPPKHKQTRMATDDVVRNSMRCVELLLTGEPRSWSVSTNACESEAGLVINKLMFPFAWMDARAQRGAHHTNAIVPGTVGLMYLP